MTSWLPLLLGLLALPGCLGIRDSQDVIVDPTKGHQTASDVTVPLYLQQSTEHGAPVYITQKVRIPKGSWVFFPEALAGVKASP